MKLLIEMHSVGCVSTWTN